MQIETQVILIAFQPPGLFFPVDGVNLVMQPLCSQLACDLVLTDISSSTAGQYKCEVSSEAPHFKVVEKNTNLTVAGS
jgi:hypothetical protein